MSAYRFFLSPPLPFLFCFYFWNAVLYGCDIDNHYEIWTGKHSEHNQFYNTAGENVLMRIRLQNMGEVNQTKKRTIPCFVNQIGSLSETDSSNLLKILLTDNIKDRTSTLIFQKFVSNLICYLLHYIWNWLNQIIIEKSAWKKMLKIGLL